MLLTPAVAAVALAKDYLRTFSGFWQRAGKKWLLRAKCNPKLYKKEMAEGGINRKLTLTSS
jgi:hypothetical protein